MKRTSQTFAWKYVVLFIVFLLLLLGLRSLWFQYSAGASPTAVQGVLDLRGWDLGGKRTIPLNGEWELYPEVLASGKDWRSAGPEPRYIQVPGSWEEAAGEREDSPFGYGTYRLRILIDPLLDEPYTFWIIDIQAASRLHINGKLAGEFGQAGESADVYKPRATSYTASFENVGLTEIELLVTVSNFDNPIQGGIAKPIRFGSQAAVDTERWYSIGFQLVTFIVLLLHGLYAVVLFLFNPRQKAFLVFFLLLVAAGISIVSDHDKLLLLWLQLNYTWALKIRMLSYMWLTFFMVLLARYFSDTPSGSTRFRLYAAVLGAYSAFIVAAPATLVYYSYGFRVFSVLYMLPFIWFVYLIGRMVRRKEPDAFFLLVAATSIASSVIWGLIGPYGKVSAIYYPIDIIAAIVGFSAYWFKRYVRNAQDNAKLNEQLRKSDKLKDQFLAQTSHELRTPLHAIMNIARTVANREKPVIGGRSLRDMELLVSISRQMSRLLDDLLDVVRLKEERIQLHRKPVHVQSVASGVMGMLVFMTDNKPIALQVDIPESMPPVLADEKRLVQIIQNLVHNAITYTNEGSVTMTAEAKDGMLVTYVTDTGSGMDEETLARIFLPYEQGTPGLDRSRGIGLGLSICKQLVELQGGTLTVRSEPGKGSEFSFTLPLAAVSESESSSSAPAFGLPAEEEIAAADRTGTDRPPDGDKLVAASPLPDVSPPLAAGKIHILVVDDDPINLKVLSGILSAESYQVRTTTSPRQALELLAAGQWDLVIADVMMPEMSGYELTRRIRERYAISELPVLLLTARSQPEDSYAGFQAGANDYVTKPVDALDLKYRIWSLAAVKQSLKERLRMEAAYLQSQIHPHFLFNTLNSIMALSELDTDKMRKLGDAFTSYLRISFDFLNAGELVGLSHELELVEAYLYIEKERFEERLTVVWEVEPDIELLLPPLTIQPLVENAVKHGVCSRVQGGTVRIRILRLQGAVHFEVQDDGRGMDEETVNRLLSRTTSRGGIGLINTNRRLKQLYGKGLSVRSQPGEGTSVSFEIPDAVRSAQAALADEA
ncbi:hybrid sensor histidine kinase/response regulator [Paenibacillus oceani]|uniref:histidine kinase n=1 Tax=Paenibacillus oceani TaxID=2772510 RepID=A0A927CG89_9BACL|nr:ATP-binding protein [Paenibacillus oceani]MBD2866093.1 response regulator [Paenibacillus oceani]